MINTVRRVLLLVALSVIGLAGFYFFKVLDTTISIGNVKLKVMEEGIDVEIDFEEFITFTSYNNGAVL